MKQIWCDGSSRGNPGKAAWAIVIEDKDSHVVESEKFSDNATNNEAEYLAVIRALQCADTSTVIYTDSALVVGHLTRNWKVGSQLRKYHDKCKELMANIPGVKIEYIPREQNNEANTLAQKRSGDGI